jgi:hypothetical protein
MSTRGFRKTVSPDAVPRELLPGQSQALLQTLHLLDRDGRLHADARRKLKQINHLVRLLTPALEDVLTRHTDPVVVDAGAGNAYLGFILYELFFGPADKGTLFAVESRADLAERVRQRAEALGYTRLRMIESVIEGAALPERMHMLVALHACDTATDDALLAAIEGGADHVAVVPCCQAEVARQLSGDGKDDPVLGQLWRHRWHRREFGAHLTNVIRALTLEAFGYQVTVTELTGWEHSLKNELILGRRVHRENRQARRTLEDLLERIPSVRPKIVRSLGVGKAGA